MKFSFEVTTYGRIEICSILSLLLLFCDRLVRDLLAVSLLQTVVMLNRWAMVAAIILLNFVPNLAKIRDVQNRFFKNFSSVLVCLLVKTWIRFRMNLVKFGLKNAVQFGYYSNLLLM